MKTMKMTRMKFPPIKTTLANLLPDNLRLNLLYWALPLLLYLVASQSNLVFKGWYAAILSACNIVMAVAFYLQFPLAARLKRSLLFSHIDWGVRKHKRMGQVLALFFLLHPLLIVLPKFALSNNDGIHAMYTMVFNPNAHTLTGIFAWLGLIAWVLLAIFKDKLPMKYETWKLTHLLGFIVIIVLSTIHITSVGRHGQIQPAIDLMWWALCALCCYFMLYNYLVKPQQTAKHPLTLKSVEKVSSSDWAVTLTADNAHDFTFKAGQFVWLSTDSTASPMTAHPFSIASSPKALPDVSFVIRALGDYTSHLGELHTGQAVYLDGAYGDLTLDLSTHYQAITLIAGGVGIGPMLGLLRELAAQNDPRPIRLLYANRSLAQMVYQDEIKALAQTMPNFKQHLITEESPQCEDISQGYINADILNTHSSLAVSDNNAFYLCGPKAMVEAVSKTLRRTGIAKQHIYFEHLAF